MANARFAWGIDIGNRALKAVKLVRDGDQLRVDDFEIIEHEHVLSNAGDNRESLIQSALANFVQRHPVRGGAVAIGVSGQSSFARFIKLPPVETKKIPEIVKFEAIQQIPFPLDDVEWSYQLFQDPASPDVEVGIFAMRKELVNRHIQYFTDVDLSVQVVQMNPLAVYNAMYYDQRIKGTTMIVDLGAENTDLIIADGETIWLRSIPIGGNNFTEALVKSFKLNFAKAEDLKRNAATSKYARQIFQAMRPVFADLVAEIQRSIGFYASVHRDSRIKRIVALGGTFRLPGLQKYLQQNLQLEVDRIDNFASAMPADGKVGTALSENLLSMFSAYGLALQGMGESKITSSLLPEHIRRERVWKEKTKWFAAAAALFVLGTGVGVTRYYIERLNIEQAASTQSQIQQTLSKATQFDSEWTEVSAAGAPDRELITNVQSLQSGRNFWVNLLADIRSTLPEPQQPLLTGNVDEIKKIPRAQREVVLIDTIKTQYVPDFTSILADPNFNRYAADSKDAGGIRRDRNNNAPAGGMMDPMMMDPMMMMGPGMMPPPGVGPAGAGGPPAAAAPSGGGSRARSTPQRGSSRSRRAAAAAPVVEQKPVERGFLITMTVVTPNADPVRLVDGSLVQGLLAKTQQVMGDKRYYIAKASIISRSTFEANPARMQAMEQSYAALTGERRGAVRTTAGGRGGAAGAMPGMPGAMPGMMDPMMGPPGMMTPDMMLAPGGMMPPAGGRGAAPARRPTGARGGNDAADAQAEAAKAYQDRLTGEDMRKDSEVKVLVAVVIDPPPKKAEESSNPTP